MNFQPKTSLETYKLFLLLFTIIMPITAGLCLLLSILVFCLAGSVWWLGLLFLAFAVAVFGVYWMIRGYMKNCIAIEEIARQQKEEQASHEVQEEAPLAEVANEEE